MSNTIDQRVVEMKFDNAQFEKNVQTSMVSIDQLKQSLDFTGVGSSIVLVTQKFSALEQIAVGALRKIGAQALDAGEKFLKSMSVDQISAGWQKFADKTSSVQTIMAATRSSWEESANAMARSEYLVQNGVDQVLASGIAKRADDLKNGVISLDEAVQQLGGNSSDALARIVNQMQGVTYSGSQMDYVSDQLARLNWFTDETSYKLIDMVGNIGKFTSAGVDLETSVSAMEGIATWAAISGKNADAASIAMYNISQALGAGKVLAIDWKSIENQNMATREFKQIVLETAESLGTLKRVSEDTWVTVSDGSEVTNAKFKDAFKDGWFTSDVLLQSLQKYGDFAVELQRLSSETELSATDLLDRLTSYKEASAGLADSLIKEGVDADLANGVAERYKKIASGMMTMEEAASELGTSPIVISNLTKRMDKFVSGAVDFEGMLEEIKETCPDTTLTIEDLRKEFNYLTDDTMDLGMRAFKAAQEAKTFQEAVDYVKEAVSTGWSTTFEKVFGNYEEAKALWSQLAEDFYTLFVESGDIRNSILDTWKKAGGRDQLVEAFWNIFHAIMAIVDAIKGAIQDVFNPLFMDAEGGASRLWKLTANLNNFSKSLKLTDDETGELNETGQKLKSTFKGVFAIFGIVGDVLEALIKPIFQLIPGIGSVGSGVLDATASFGDMLVAFRETINSSEFLEEVTTRLGDAFKALGEFVGNMMEIFRGVSYIEGGGGIGGVVESIFDSIVNVVKLGFDLVSALTGRNYAFIRDRVVKAIQDVRDLVVEYIGPTEEFLQRIGAGFKKAIGSIKDAFKSFQDIDLSSATSFSDKVHMILDKIAEKFEQVKAFFQKITPYVKGVVKVIGGIFYAIGVVLAETGKKLFDFFKEASIVDIVNFIKGLAQSFLYFKTGKLLDTMSGFGKSAKGFVEGLKTLTDGLKKSAENVGKKILKFAISMAILAGALYLIAKIDIPKLIVAGTVIAVLMYELSVVAKNLNGTTFGKDQKFSSGATQILAFSAAILILAVALKKISDIEPTQMLASIAAIGILIAAMYAVTKGLEESKGLSGLSALLAMGAAVLLLSISMKKIGEMNWSQIGMGLAALTGIIVLLTASMKIISSGSGSTQKNMAEVLFLMSFASAVKKLANVFMDLSTMKWDEMLRAMTGLTIVVAEMTIATKILSKNTAGAKALTVSAIALLLFVSVIKKMAKMEWETIGKGLAVIAAALLTIGGLSAILTYVAPTMLLVGKAFLMLSLGTLAFAAALAVLSVAAPLFVVSARLIAKGLVLLLVDLIGALPQLIEALTRALYDSAKDIVDFIVAIIGLICAAIRSSADDIAITVMDVIVVVLNAIGERSEEISAALLEIFIVGPLKGVRDKIPELASVLSEIFTALIDSMSVLGNGNLEKSLEAVGILEKIMWKLGVISGMAWIMSGALPKIGTKLSEFGTNVTPFLRILSRVPPSALRASKSFAEMLVIMTSAEIKDALTSWFTGRDRLADMGEQLALFAPDFRRYADIVSGMDAQGVIDSAPALEAIAGVWIPYTDASTYEELGKGLDAIGSKLKDYGSNVSGLPATDVIASADAITALSTALYNMQTINPEDVVLFGQALKDYGDAVDGIKSYSISLSLEPAQKLLDLDAGVTNQSWNLFKGNRTLGAFGENLVAFGKALKDYGDAVNGMKTYMIGLSIEPAQALLDLDAGVTNQSWNLFKGNRTLGAFGENLVAFGKALKDYGDALDGIKTYTIELSIRSAQALVDFDAGVTNQSWNFFKSDRIGGSFGEDLVGFGKALKDYGDAIDGMKTYMIGLSIEPAQALIDLDAGVTNQSWNLFKGERTLGAFGENLVGFGKALKDYGDAIDGMKTYMIGLSIEPAQALIDLDAGVTNQSWNLFKGNRTLGAFGENLVAFGQALHDYGDAVDGLKNYSIGLSIESAEKLMALSELTPEGNFKSWLFGKDTLADFGTNLASFGESMGAFSDALTNVDTTVFGRVRTGLNILTSIKVSELEPVLEQMASLMDVIVSIDNYGSGGNAEKLATALRDLANTGIESLAKAFEDPVRVSTAIDTFMTNIDGAISDKHDEMEQIADDLAKAFVNELAFDLRKSKQEIGQATSQLVSHIRTYRYDFYKAGGFLVEGFAGGIDSSRWKAEAAGRAMVKKTFEAVQAEEDAHSPSRKAEVFGGYLVDGFIKPIYDRVGDLRKAGKDLASETLDATNEVIGRIADFVDAGMDTQPTIRPVLDLTDVTDGFGSLNAMFSRRQAVGISARMGDMRTMNGEGDISTIGGTNYNFVQNNYSPKALNAPEIYRQTKNQFSKVKGWATRR